MASGCSISRRRFDAIRIHEADQRSVRTLIHARRDDHEQGIQRVNVVHGLVFSIIEHVECGCCAHWSNNI